MKERIGWYLRHQMGQTYWRYLDLCPSWACNAKCPTCGSWKRPKASLTTEQCSVIVYGKAFKHIRRLVIEGGEPTLWPELSHFVMDFIYTHPKAIVGIITNGIAYKRIKRLADEMVTRKKNIRWVISLNGVGELHDKSRGVKDAYRCAAISAYELSRQYPVNFSFVPFKENIGDFEKVLQVGVDLNIPVQICYPSKSAKFGEGQGWTMLSSVTVNDVARTMTNNFKWFVDRWAWQMFIEKAKRRELMPCWAGEQLIHINPAGTILPCSMNEKFPIGSLSPMGVNPFEVTENDYTDTYHYFGRIPSECQYASYQVCNSCYIFQSLSCEPLKLLKWRLRRCFEKSKS